MPESKPQFTKRMARWTMFGYLGSCRWIMSKMGGIRESEHCSPVSKRLAIEISTSAEALMLSIRKDIKEIK